MIVSEHVYCCLIQYGKTPLQVAIQYNATAVVYLLMDYYNKKTSHISQVSNLTVHV